MSERIEWLYDTLETPLGELRIVAGADGALRQVGWEMRPVDGMQRRQDPFGFTSALRAYFNGELSAVDELKTAAEGTPFQRAVWAGLREIGCGETLTYGELAARLARGGAARATGAAAGANPVAIVVPCHRLVGAGGKLTGYAGGLDRKRWLLAHERTARLG